MLYTCIRARVLRRRSSGGCSPEASGERAFLERDYMKQFVIFAAALVSLLTVLLTFFGSRKNDNNTHTQDKNI
ncbi:MAG: hypothetical protein LUG91_07960 [Ruminococcus sp.]|nr:hypothetical protein [Ruminococcus sp.]